MMAKNHAPRFLQLVESVRPQIRECTVAEVWQRLQQADRFTLIDVREDHEWAAGHLPGAVHLGKGILERDVESRFPDPATPLVLYCGGGFRSALAAYHLKLMGYTDVLTMDGGIRGWKEDGHPIETHG